jgi:hypothetical protein
MKASPFRKPIRTLPRTQNHMIPGFEDFDVMMGDKLIGFVIQDTDDMYHAFVNIRKGGKILSTRVAGGVSIAIALEKVRKAWLKKGERYSK